MKTIKDVLLNPAMALLYLGILVGWDMGILYERSVCRDEVNRVRENYQRMLSDCRYACLSSLTGYQEIIRKLLNQCENSTPPEEHTSP